MSKMQHSMLLPSCGTTKDWLTFLDVSVEGVWKEPGCFWKVGDLDHAVTLMGYGVSTHGNSYWLIKYACTYLSLTLQLAPLMQCFIAHISF